MYNCENTHTLRNPTNSSILIKELTEQKRALEVAVCTLRPPCIIFIASNKPLMWCNLNYRRHIIEKELWILPVRCAEISSKQSGKVCLQRFSAPLFLWLRWNDEAQLSYASVSSRHDVICHDPSQMTSLSKDIFENLMNKVVGLILCFEVFYNLITPLKACSRRLPKLWVPVYFLFDSFSKYTGPSAFDLLTGQTTETPKNTKSTLTNRNL